AAQRAARPGDGALRLPRPPLRVAEGAREGQSEGEGRLVRWRPLLEGDDAERAREAIAAIATDLAAVPIAEVDLDRGLAGRALLHACLARAGDPLAVDRAAEALEGALDGMGRLTSPWLLDGVAGVAWTAAHLGDVIELDDDVMAALDQLVAHSLAHEPWPFEWEYIGGLLGLAVYALERPD